MKPALAIIPLVAAIVSNPGFTPQSQAALPVLETVGFSGNMHNTSLARRTAQNRAIDGLHKLLTTIDFEWRTDKWGEQLTLAVPNEALGNITTQVKALHHKQWMATAKLQLQYAPEPIPTYYSPLNQASATISHKDLATAHRIAESKALRRLLKQAAGITHRQGLHQGKLRLKAMRVSQRGRRVKVTVQGYAFIESSESLNLADRHLLLLATSDEYRALGKRKRLVRILKQLGKKEMAMRLPHDAAQRFEEASRLSSSPRQRMQFKKLELYALRAWGSPAARARILELEAQLGR